MTEVRDCAAQNVSIFGSCAEWLIDLRRELIRALVERGNRISPRPHNIFRAPAPFSRAHKP